MLISQLRNCDCCCFTTCQFVCVVQKMKMRENNIKIKMINKLVDISQRNKSLCNQNYCLLKTPTLIYLRLTFEALGLCII